MKFLDSFKCNLKTFSPKNIEKKKDKKKKETRMTGSVLKQDPNK